MKKYTVTIGGIEHTLMLDAKDVEFYSTHYETLTEVKDEPAASPVPAAKAPKA